MMYQTHVMLLSAWKNGWKMDAYFHVTCQWQQKQQRKKTRNNSTGRKHRPPTRKS